MENPFLGIEAVLFDLDGTLVETHIDFPLMKREMLQLAAAYDVPSEFFVECDILAVVESARTSLIDLGRTDDSVRLRTEAFAILEKIEIEQCANPVAIAGARELIDALRHRGIRVGIVTRNCATVSRQLVRFAGISHDALVTRDDVARTKPDPLHLATALSLLGQPGNPTLDTQHSTLRCLIIGDHWMDVLAGRNAGMRTIGISRRREPGFFDPAQPDLLVREIAELLTFLQ